MRPYTDSTATVVNRFSSGRTAIDRFLKNKAKKATRRLEQRVFCAHVEASPIVIGYYSLHLGSDSVDELPDANKNNYLKNWVSFPSVHLSYLGVDSAFRRQGLGSYLLMDAFARVAQIAEHAGFYALTLISLDEASTAFYKSLNFVEYSDEKKNPKLLYPIKNILELVAD